MSSDRIIKCNQKQKIKIENLIISLFDIIYLLKEGIDFSKKKKNIFIKTIKIYHESQSVCTRFTKVHG